MKVLRNVIAYKPSKVHRENVALFSKIRQWVDLFLDFSDKNIESLSMLKTALMDSDDIAEVASIVREMIALHEEICGEDSNQYREQLDEVLKSGHDSVSLTYGFNRLINHIHQDVLRNIFGVFTGWKKVVGEINTISNKAVSITVDDEGTIEHFPANKVNIIDYSDDFESGRAVVARRIIEAYLSTNVRLRDNCYIDCISHTNKAWFFADLGLHGANIFVDLDPTQRLITVSYAEGNVEDGNMVRLRFLIEALEALGFRVERTEITFKATLDKQNAGLLSADELIDRATWALQVFASVADFDLEIEDGGISERALRYHRDRLCYSGTGYPLYIISQGTRELKKVNRLMDDVNRGIVSILNQDLDGLEINPIPDNVTGAKAIDSFYNKPIAGFFAIGKLVSYKTAPLVRNPYYAEPDPLCFLEENNDAEYSAEVATIVNILDKTVGSKYVGAVEDKRVTISRADIAGEKISFYALRDKDTNKAIKAFAVDGSCLRMVSGMNNVITDSQAIRSILIENGYSLEDTFQRWEWPIPMASNVGGIKVPGIRSCPGVATGFLKKNRHHDIPGHFHNAVFSDTILTPSEVGRLREATGFLTINDSTLSHAQLTARTFGKPGVIIPGAVWYEQEGSYSLTLSSDEQDIVVEEGHVITVDGTRGMVTIVGASYSPLEDQRELIRKIFSLLVSVNSDMEVCDSAVELRDIIIRADNVEILKFIIQELFITHTVHHVSHKLKILTLVLDCCRTGLQGELVEYLKEIVTDYRRRQQYDIELAKHKLVSTVYVDEALHVINRIYTQVQMPKEMEDLLCKRAGMCTLDYSAEIDEIEELYRKKIVEFKAGGLEEIARCKNDASMATHETLGKIHRMLERLSLLPLGPGAIDEAIKGMAGDVRQDVAAYQKRFACSGRRLVVELQHTGGVISPYVGNKAAFLGDLLETPMGKHVLPGYIVTRFGVKEIIENNADAVETIRRILTDSLAEKTEVFKAIAAMASDMVYPNHLREEIIRHYHAFERSASAEEKVCELLRLAGLGTLGREKMNTALHAVRELVRSDALTVGECIVGVGMHPSDQEQLLDTYEQKGGVFVVVRSSSILEDTHQEMMAGRFKSYPYVRGKELLLNSILKCLAYYWIEMREVTDTQPVFVHRQMEADVSLVINSINMVEEKWDEIVINSARGAGAGLVAGMVDSDLYFVDANHFSVKRVITSTKRTRCAFDDTNGFGVKTVAIDDPAEQAKPTLSEEAVSRIARLAKDIQDYFRYPVDIEAVTKDDIVYVVQVRPIVLPPPVTGLNR
ncbi:MAG: hypothetical protein JXD19_00450 [Deltaproteobacteria bacterium]|nr:hypothetical protein [Deltaproteobacteria bacterium]